MKCHTGALARVVLPALVAAAYACAAQPTVRTATAPRARKSTRPSAHPQPAAPDVLTNEEIIRMTAAGVDDSVIVAKIASTPARFELGTAQILDLKAHHVSSQVLRAMLNKAAPPQQPAAVVREVKDPGPAAPATPAIDTAKLDAVTVREGATVTTLADRPMKMMFVKSDAVSPKAAIANLLLSDVGMNLLTMGLGSQMMAWNPYSAEILSRAGELGRGMLTGKGSETKGFEYEMLSGIRSDRELKAGNAEFYIPAARYAAPGAELDWTTVQPVILRLDVRASDQARLLSGRQVTVKRIRKGRLDFKPQAERQAAALEQIAVPAAIERTPNNVFVVRTSEPLGAGEYALVLRRISAAGTPTENVPLKGTELAGTPETTPEQQAMAAEQQAIAEQQQSRSRMGLFGRRSASPPSEPHTDMTQFIAWDFRVVQ